jgi:hypothetical protein
LIPDSTNLVRQAKQDVIALGINPDASEANRFEITKRVAYQLSKIYPEVGLLYKPTGNNVQGCAVDIICLTDGTIIDILGGGSDGPNTPQWLINLNKVDVSRWCTPFQIESTAQPTPTPASPASTVPQISKAKAIAFISAAIGVLSWLMHVLSKDESDK